MKTSIFILIMCSGMSAVNSWGQFDPSAIGTGNYSDSQSIQSYQTKTTGGKIEQKKTYENVSNAFSPNNKQYLYNKDPSAKAATAATNTTATADKQMVTCYKNYTNEDGTTGAAQLSCANGCEGFDGKTCPTEKSAVTCGNGIYGGANCDTTDVINHGITESNGLMQGMGISAISKTKTSAESDVAAKGSDATQSDYYKAQAKVANDGKKMNNAAGMVQMAAFATQAWRATEHFRSVAEVNGFKCGTDDAICATEKANEAKAQNKKAVETTGLAAVTAMNASISFMEANKAGNLANALNAQGNGPGGGQFNFDPNLQQPISEGAAITQGTAETQGGVVDEGSNGEFAANGLNKFNPNVDEIAGAALPGATTQLPNDVQSATNAGLGGTGGTSASKDSGDGKEQAPAGKSQVGGQYAAGDGAGSKFSRGGSGAGVGVNFADMLKNLLPKDDLNAKKSSLELSANDRSPASDQAAVMGRGKNIFLEISKRYQKKNNEGSVVFQ